MWHLTEMFCFSDNKNCWKKFVVCWMWYVCREHVLHGWNIRVSDDSCTSTPSMAHVLGIYSHSGGKHSVWQQSDSNKEIWDWRWWVRFSLSDSVRPQVGFSVVISSTFNVNILRRKKKEPETWRSLGEDVIHFHWLPVLGYCQQKPISGRCEV